MEGRSDARDRYDVGTPEYTARLFGIALSLAAGVAAFLSLLATEVPLVWRAVAAGGTVVGSVAVVNAWFAARWVWCQWRKARLYEALLSTKRALDERLAAWRGTLALAAELPRLPVEGLYEERGRLLIVLARVDLAAPQRGDTLLVVDTVAKRLVGKARVVVAGAQGSEAEVHDPLDAVFWGFVHQEIACYRRQAPPDLAVFREADVLERQQAFARLMEEVQQ